MSDELRLLVRFFCIIQQNILNRIFSHKYHALLIYVSFLWALGRRKIRVRLAKPWVAHAYICVRILVCILEIFQTFHWLVPPMLTNSTSARSNVHTIRAHILYFLNLFIGQLVVQKIFAKRPRTFNSVVLPSIHLIIFISELTEGHRADSELTKFSNNHGYSMHGSFPEWH